MHPLTRTHTTTSVLPSLSRTSTAITGPRDAANHDDRDQSWGCSEKRSGAKTTNAFNIHNTTYCTVAQVGHGAPPKLGYDIMPVRQSLGRDWRRSTLRYDTPVSRVMRFRAALYLWFEAATAAIVGWQEKADHNHEVSACGRHASVHQSTTPLRTGSHTHLRRWRIKVVGLLCELKTVSSG
jgi:hypothetical protein